MLLKVGFWDYISLLTTHNGEKIKIVFRGFKAAKKLPKDTGLDNTLKMINEAYTYVPKRLESLEQLLKRVH